jgi:hypothetical protein
MHEKILVIVDGDPIVYRAGFAAQNHEQHVVIQIEDEVDDLWFSRKDGKTPLARRKEHFAKMDEEGYNYEIIDEEVVIVPEPLENCLATVKAILKETRYTVAEHFHKEPKDVVLRILLSGPDNFRYDVATIKPYKGNRKEDSKPFWYQQIRNYLTESWDAEVISGREADDECSIVQRNTDGQTIIATIDKDLDMVPGDHYDYVRRTFYQTAPDDGLAIFYKQILSGDSTDNIGGCYKVGAVGAATLVDTYLSECPGDWEGLWLRVVEEYQRSIDKYGEKCPYFDLHNTSGPESVALENARLVWMQEYEGQLWTPPGQADESLTNEGEYEHE